MLQTTTLCIEFDALEYSVSLVSLSKQIQCNFAETFNKKNLNQYPRLPQFSSAKLN